MLVLVSAVPPAAAQTFDAAGARAAGMGGAFVAVADDASAAYWNPAGFASGSYFSLVLDRNSAEVNPTGDGAAASRSGFLLALGMPALGLSYYRLRSVGVRPVPAAGIAMVAADTLVTHHTGVTLVQSLAPGLAVGTTVKLVRGFAGSTLAPASAEDDLLKDDVSHSRGTTRFDADIGVMGTLGRLKAGLTIRNVSEPSFATAGADSPLKLERQARAGVAVRPVDGWTVATDWDLLETSGPAGPSREFAIGTEGRVHRRAFVRGGFHVNTTGAREPAATAGATFAATPGFLIDAQATGGSDRGARGWGVSVRFLY